MNVNLEEIKQYNDRLKAKKEQISKHQVEIEYNQKELEKNLAELSQALGMTITTDNIQEVYNNEVNKINTMLQSGKAVLDKIDNVSNAGNVQVDMTQAPVMQATPQVDNNMQQVNMMGGQVNNVAEQVVTQPVQTVQPNVVPVVEQQTVPQTQAAPNVNAIFGGAPIVNPMGDGNGQQAPLPQLFGI